MIESRLGDRMAAFEVPFKACGECCLYVSPMWFDFDRILDPIRNPLCSNGRGELKLFTAHRSGVPIGRIVASVHHASNARHGTTVGHFDFFAYVYSFDVASVSIDAAGSWLRDRRVDVIVRNFNRTAMQITDVVIDGFDQAPYKDIIWSPGHLDRKGYNPSFPMTTFETNFTTIDPEVFLGQQQRGGLSDADSSWQPITMRTFKQRMEDARLVFNDGSANNPMLLSLCAEEYRF